jgi:hypothetical protein
MRARVELVSCPAGHNQTSGRCGRAAHTGREIDQIPQRAEVGISVPNATHDVRAHPLVQTDANAGLRRLEQGDRHHLTGVFLMTQAMLPTRRPL